MSVINYKKHLPVVFSVFLVCLSSCNNEFSKYKKTDKNDLEKLGLVGNVKSVTRYYDGEIVDMDNYNRYGFETETVDYSDGEIDETITYSYNEFGKISRKETKNKTFHRADITLFDEIGNAIEESTEIYEVYEANSDLTVGKRLDYTYENNYDKFGGLISCKCLRRDGSCLFEKQYNQSGKLSKVIEYDEEGSVKKLTDYSYRGNVLAVEITTYPKLHRMYDICYYNQQGKMEKWSKLYEDKSIDEIHEYFFDHNGFMTKDVCTWVVSFPFSELNIGDICHTITAYDRDEHGSILKETKTTYYPYEDMSIPKEAEEIKKFQYKYDNYGNVIYEKDYEGHEYKYEITYY